MKGHSLNEDLARDAGQTGKLPAGTYPGVLELLPCAVFSVDSERRITSWNRGAVQLTGYAAEEVLGQPCTSFALTPCSESCALMQPDLRGPVMDRTCQIRHRDGRILTISKNSQVLRDGDGTVEGGVESFFDITGRNRAEGLIKAQRDVVVALAGASDLEEVLVRCLDTALEVSGMDCGGVYLVEEDAGGLELLAHRGLSAGFVEVVRRFSSDAPNARMVHQGEAIFSSYDDIKRRRVDAELAEGLRGIAIIPIRHEGRVIACLNVASHDLDEVPEYSREVLQTIGAQMGNAIARAKAEQALHGYREQLEQRVTERTQELRMTRFVVENATDSIFVASKESRFIYANESACRFLGFSLEEILALRIEDIDPFMGGPGGHERMSGVLSRGHGTFETEMKRKDGRIVLVEMTVNVVEYEGDICLVAFGRDITEKRRVEDALWASDARLRAVAEALPDLVFVIDEDGRYLEILTAEEQLLAQEASSLKGRLMSEVLPRQQANKFLDVVHRTLATGENQVCEYTLEVPAGRRHFEGRAAPMGIGQDGKETMVFIARDITDRVAGEQRVQELNASLELRVRERTRQLEAVNQELESFAYSVSHDLRAPLRSIDGFSRAVLEDHGKRLDDQGRDYLERACAASRHMAALIDDLLSLSRLTRQRIECARVDLSKIAIAVVDELQVAEPLREVAVTIAEGLQAQGDGVLLEVILRNLLGNAWKFTAHSADARIELGTRLEGEEQIFFVQDNGAGFDMKYAHKLFSPFQRLHGVKEYPGNGVGLATVKRAIARHGGRLWAEGIPGEGATFYFSLPPNGGGHMQHSSTTEERG